MGAARMVLGPGWLRCVEGREGAWGPGRRRRGVEEWGGGLEGACGPTGPVGEHAEQCVCEQLADDTGVARGAGRAQ